MNGQDDSAQTFIHWLRVNSRETRNRIYQATTIANSFPGGPQGPRQPANPDREFPSTIQEPNQNASSGYV